MGVLGNNAIIGASAAGAYEIERSLRFNASDETYLNRTPGTSTYTKGTYSFWAKKTTNGKINTIIQSGRDGSNNNQAQVAFWNDDCLQIYSYHSSAYKLNFKTNAQYRDNAAWYHVVFAWDTTQGTNTNRAKLYVNGEQVTSFSTATYPNQNEVMMFDNPNASSSGVNRIGTYWTTGSTPSHNYDGYLSDLHYVDGTQLAASDFGKRDPSTDAWIPVEYLGTHGTNGYYLKFDDNSGTTATTLGKDEAGSNNWTPNNFSVAAGPGNDSVVDTPTNNYCILDYLDRKDSLLINGALSTATSAGGGHQPGFSTFGLTSGKWYVEGGKITSNATTVCVWPKEHDFHSLTQDHAVHNNAGNQNAKGYGFNLNYGSATHTPSHTISSYTGTSFTTWMLALDLDNGKIWWGVDGTWGNNSGVGNPATGANPAFSDLISGYPGEVWSVGSMTTNGHNLSFNFGQQGFAYTPPDGFKPICTANLPTPSIKKGSDHMNTILYTGNATSRNIVSDFSTDFVWIKRRSGQESHVLADRVRGANEFLMSNSSAVKNTAANCVTAFNNDGVTVGTQGIVNDNNETFVSWHWNESASAGFDIVSYSGNDNADRDITHSLNAVPDLFIVKSRTNTADWYVMHPDSGANKYVVLSAGAAQGTNTVLWANQLPTSAHFTVGENGSGWATNENGEDYICYLWTSIDGYSKIGRYPGNQNNNGPFVYTGFRPQWVMVKPVNGNNWAIFDDKRDPENGMDQRLHPNLDIATNSGAGQTIDFLSNGFKIRTTDTLENPSSAWVIYMAFAKTPYKYSNAY